MFLWDYYCVHFSFVKLRLCLNLYKLFFSVLYFYLPRTSADFELDQLQEKLRETELVMEKIVSNAHHSPDRWESFDPSLQP